MDLPYITFFTAANLGTFWQYVKALMFIVMPLLLIYLATHFAGQLISVIRGSFSGTNVDNPVSSKDEKSYDIKIKEKY